MKPIQVADQPRLPFGRILRIAITGIRYRLFRASVTVAVIAVAVAFLLNILSESLIKRSVARETQDRLAQIRLVHRWTARLSAPTDAAALLRELAAATPAGPEWQEFARMGRLEVGEAEALHRAATDAAGYLDFFEQLDYGHRRRLVHDAEGTAILDRLAATGGLAAFRTNLARTASVRLPGAAADLDRCVIAWPGTRARVARVQDGQRIAVRHVSAARAGGGLLEAMAGPDKRVFAAAREAGFGLTPALEAVLSAQSRDAVDARLVELAFNCSAVRQAVARRYDTLPGDVTLVRLWSYLEEPGNAEECSRVLQGAGDPAAVLAPARLRELADRWREQQRLERASHLTADVGSGALGLGERMTWLLSVSMLVCAVGVCNAMLMTVTERFRAIATLKCLGALDGSIMLLFVMESCLLGVVGGCLGGLAGALLGTARTMAAFGTSFAAAIPLGQLAAGVALSVLVGVVLAALAAVYPSFRAARLAPMEAMRVE